MQDVVAITDPGYVSSVLLAEFGDGHEISSRLTGMVQIRQRINDRNRCGASQFSDVFMTETTVGDAV